jgi:hypothetical protein
MACNAGAIVLQQVRHSNAAGPVFDAFFTRKNANLTNLAQQFPLAVGGQWTLRPPPVGLSLRAAQPGQQNFQ